MITRILAAFWREIAIGGLVLIMWGSYSLYFSPKIENLELKLELQKAKTEQCEAAFETQSKEILEEAKNSREATEAAFASLTEMLENLEQGGQDQVDDILDEDVPSTEACEELNEYLVDMVKNLQWENGNE